MFQANYDVPNWSAVNDQFPLFPIPLTLDNNNRSTDVAGGSKRVALSFDDPDELDDSDDVPAPRRHKRRGGVVGFGSITGSGGNSRTVCTYVGEKLYTECEYDDDGEEEEEEEDDDDDDDDDDVIETGFAAAVKDEPVEIESDTEDGNMGDESYKRWTEGEMGVLRDLLKESKNVQKVTADFIRILGTRRTEVAIYNKVSKVILRELDCTWTGADAAILVQAVDSTDLNRETAIMNDFFRRANSGKRFSRHLIRTKIKAFDMQRKRGAVEKV
ncbi:uncharacterized protein LAJ45_00620 [Morchella importuna]|uniref:uncharacterized protein n=1 Tax=Morchella importuna TaxID=1174673 RepID=UPI001E8E50DE|nr:uncharacterized protein LAJ45_00620 [Morchella importuna]KAH8155610.1 hypothetical protein LAJ45_00620 [Morchella importuna]